MTRRIRIETLVLENVPASQRAALLRAFRAELARLAAQPPAAAPPRAVQPAPASGSAAGLSAAAVVARRIGGGR
jgi:hypothetical protein